MLYNNLQIKQLSKKGLSIVEVIVVAGIVAVFFSSLLSSFYFTVSLVQNSRIRQSALSVANNQIEYIRSLSYDTVGTVAGIPAGAIPQSATTTLNNISFTIKTLIDYVDDPADGLGLSDDNSITTDYKTAKVTVVWQWRGVSYEIFLLTRVIPRSIETDVGGGTIRVNVFDAGVSPLAGASVRLVNSSLTPVIDVTRTTNADGVALFGGAPAGAGYEVTVTRDGYSTDSTNPITAELVNPSTPPATVAEADITTLNFFIDVLSTLNIKTVSATSYEKWSESFASTTGMVSSTGVAVTGGELVLEGGAGSYVGSGTAMLQPIVPTSLNSWSSINIVGEVSSSSTRTVQVYTADTPAVLIPDSDLPGNSGGFASDTVDISALDVSTYPAISLGLNLDSADSNVTPTVDELVIEYVASLSSLPNVPLSISGNKIIGTRGDGTLVYKFSQSASTDGGGNLSLTNLEWDTYTINPTGYTITEACTENPVSVVPNNVVELRLTLESVVNYALRVVVVDNVGAQVSGAEVTLTRTGYTDTQETSPCGQASFLPLSANNDYTLLVDVGGVEVWSQADIIVGGNDLLVIQLP